MKRWNSSKRSRLLCATRFTCWYTVQSSSRVSSNTIGHSSYLDDTFTCQKHSELQVKWHQEVVKTEHQWLVSAIMILLFCIYWCWGDFKKVVKPKKESTPCFRRKSNLFSHNYCQKARASFKKKKEWVWMYPMVALILRSASAQNERRGMLNKSHKDVLY